MCNLPIFRRHCKADTASNVILMAVLIATFVTQCDDLKWFRFKVTWATILLRCLAEVLALHFPQILCTSSWSSSLRGILKTYSRTVVVREVESTATFMEPVNHSPPRISWSLPRMSPMEWPSLPIIRCVWRHHAAIVEMNGELEHSNQQRSMTLSLFILLSLLPFRHTLMFEPLSFLRHIKSCGIRVD